MSVGVAPIDAPREESVLPGKVAVGHGTEQNGVAMHKVHVLVDLANNDQMRSMHRPNPALIATELDSLLAAAADSLRALLPQGVLELRFRLYDGWFDEAGDGTDLHAMARPHISKTYPTLRKSLRFFASIAEAPLASVTRLPHTMRAASGLPRARVRIESSPPHGCTAIHQCAALSLRHWLRKGCCPQPNCSAEAKEFARWNEQKMVDTTLVADMVLLAAKREDVAVVSDDEDMVPGLITAASFGGAVYWVCKSGAPRAALRNVFSTTSIRCTE